MPMKKHITASKWVDPDEAPHLGRDWFKRAEIREGERPIRLAKVGRPKKTAPKQAVNIRLDPDVLAHFRATGLRWQSRINAALRKPRDCEVLVPMCQGRTLLILERAKGFEPSTPTLARLCSTPELHPHPRRA